MSNLDNIVEFKSSPELRAKLFQYSTLKTLKKGEVLIAEHSYIRSIPIIISGSLQVLRSDEEGKEILMYYIKGGESCIMSFLGGLHNEKSMLKAVAEETTEILFLPIERVRELIREYPQWLEYIFKLYHKRFEELLELVNAIAFKKVDERLLDLLHKKQKLMGSNVLEVTHEQLAHELATARVVISRLLKQLEDKGLVELGRNKIILLK
ncbi:MAG: Crp/Fnr family transcriptional regulator [Saprospiraceae bacterium]|nr:Crp/Fnr family transcriptional regulator [Saprospiraceae bacterium]MBK8081091.1 Crp/Fnr family transcriptional regulator [Saprospiraceae bacterium]MBK8549349.1 Crp/Fnr family transcriptional regulator [Saprospiraceae bacterium]MBK8855252.1 Crp/Fnr family transcriptional regulator [Saprospiraceae bacterium]MBK9043891.1 Crp/Fnr family transcriptional regulator [Saprospiraceae bacterium]